METKEVIKRVQDEFGVVMENPDKVVRAVFGMSTSKGMVDGVGEDAEARIILDKYDELGGYMTKDGYKVKTGCFFDRKKKTSIKNPTIVFLIKVNGEVMEQVEGEKEPLEIQLAKKQEKAKKGKKKVKDEDE